MSADTTELHWAKYSLTDIQQKYISVRFKANFKVNINP